LNDPSELRHGISLAVDVLKTLGVDSLPESELLAYAIEGLLGRGVTITGHYFSCSFSRNGNDLDQWRAYADDGRGYSIGFDGNSIDKAFYDARNKPDLSHPSSFLLTYDDQKLIEIFRKLIGLVEPIAGTGSSDDFEYFRQIAMELVRRIIFFSAHFKHPAYKNEEEFRLLEMIPMRNSYKMKLRPKQHELIEYRELNWRHRGVVPKTITIGPAADQEKAFNFAKKCIHDYPGKSIEIVRSGIPYKSKLPWPVKSPSVTTKLPVS
jgi:hypothetical protein